MHHRSSGSRALVCLLLLFLASHASLLAQESKPSPAEERPEDAPAVSSLVLTGKIDGELVRLTAEMDIVALKPGQSINLACKQGQPTSLKLNGKTALVRNAPEGLLLYLDRAGTHRATVEMLVRAVPVPRSSGGPALGFDLDLPLTPVSRLDLTFPPRAQGLELDGKALAESPSLVEFKDGKLIGPLGKINRLRLAWRLPAPPTTVRQPPSATGEIIVRIDPRGAITTEAQLILQAGATPTRQWRLFLPRGSQVQPANPEDREALQGPWPTAVQGPVTLVFKEPRSAVTLRVLHSAVRSGNRQAIGPFAVAGTVRQSGSLLVSLPLNWRVRGLLPRTSTEGPAFAAGQRVPTSQERQNFPGAALVGYQYWALPGAGRDPALSWFDLELEEVQGVLDTRVTHRLKANVYRRAEGDREGPPEVRWHLATVLDVMPVRAGVEALDFDWPAAWRFDQDRGPRMGEAALPFKPDERGRLARLELPGDLLQRFQLSVEADLIGEPTAALVSGRMEFPLPRTRGTRDPRGHRIIVEAAESLDLSGLQDNLPGMELVRHEAHRLEWLCDHVPEKVTVSWRPYAPRVRAEGVVDVTLRGRPEDARAIIRQEVRYSLTELPPGDLTFRLPAGAQLLDRQASLGDGKPLEIRLEPDRRVVRCQLPRTGNGPRELVLIVEYACDCSSSQGSRITVPLGETGQVTEGPMQVRVWSEAGTSVRPAGGPWVEGPAEAVAGRSALPALVLRGSYPSVSRSLALDWSALGDAQVRSPAVERSLVQVRVGEQGEQLYRVRYLLGALRSSGLEIELPEPVSGLELQVFLAGNRVHWEPLPERGKPAEEATRARLTISPEQVVGPTVLEVRYRRANPERASLLGLVQELTPPNLPGVRAGFVTRWQVETPGGRMPLSLERGEWTGWRWGLRGWLLTPEPAPRATDLERWLLGRSASEETPEHSPATVLLWRFGSAAVTVCQVPRQAWLLGCSLTLLLTGLLLTRPPSRLAEAGKRRRFWPWAVLFGLLLTLLGLIWPGLLVALVYGVQPGLAVLLVVLLVQAVLHERHRQRLVFLPGFSRQSSSVRSQSPGVRAPSSVPKPVGSSIRPRGEPSTVDAPVQQ